MHGVVQAWCGAGTAWYYICTWYYMHMHMHMCMHMCMCMYMYMTCKYLVVKRAESSNTNSGSHTTLGSL